MARRLRIVLVLALVVPLLAPAVSAQGSRITELTVEAEEPGVVFTPGELATTPVRVHLTNPESVADTGAFGIVRLTASVQTKSGGSPRGWGASVSPGKLRMTPGETRFVNLTATSSRTAEPNDVEIIVNGTVEASGATGSTEDSSQTSLSGKLAPLRLVGLQTVAAPMTVEPHGRIEFPIRVINSGNYVDQVSLEAHNQGPLSILTPGTIGIPAKDTRTIRLTVFGPDSYAEPWQKTQIVTVQVASQNDPAATFDFPYVFYYRGYWIPPWIPPFVVMGLVAVAYAGHRKHRQIQKDRETYGHPGPKFTRAQKKKLKQVKERDEHKYELLKAKMAEKHAKKLEAYKERKRKAKQRDERRLREKLKAKRKRERKIRRKAIRRVGKMKRNGVPAKEILEELDDEEREQLGDDLPKMLAAATGAGALLAAREESERTVLDDLREDRVGDRRMRFRAEALALIDHHRRLGHDEERIREELTPNHRRALRSSFEEALAGEIDEDPETLLEDVGGLAGWNGRRLLGKLDKERKSIRDDALGVIRKAKKKDWSKKETLKELEPEQIELLGDVLPQLLEAHTVEEAELALLAEVDELSMLERRRERKLKKKLRKHRLEAMEEAAALIEERHEEGASREEILDELTRTQKWAAGDMLEILLQPLPEAIDALSIYLDEHAEEMDEDDRELWEAHLDQLRDRKLEFVEKGKKHVEKWKSKGRSPKEIVDDLDLMERECLRGAIRPLLASDLADEIAGLESYVEDEDLGDPETELWEDHIEDLRKQRREALKSGLKTVAKHRSKGRTPEAIVDRLDDDEREALDEALPAVVASELSVAIEQLESHLDEADRDEGERELLEDHLEDLREERRDVAEDAVDEIKDAKSEGRPPEAIVEELTARQRDAIGEAWERMVQAKLPEDVEALHHLIGPEKDPEAAKEAKDAAKQARRDTRRGAVDTIKKRMSKGDDPEEIVDRLSWTQTQILGEDRLEKMLAATLPEDVEVLHQVTRPDKDPEELSDAKEAAKEARDDIWVDAAKTIRKRMSKGDDPEEIVDRLDDVARDVVGDEVLEKMLAATLSEDVDVLLQASRPVKDPEELSDAKEAAKEARADVWDAVAKTVEKRRSKGDDPEEIVDRLDDVQREVVGDEVLEKMLTSTVPEDVRVLRQVHGPGKDPEALKDAKEAAQKARKEVRSRAQDKVRKAMEKGASREEALDDLDPVERELWEPVPEGEEPDESSGGLLPFGGGSDDEDEDEDETEDVADQEPEESSSGGLLGGLLGGSEEPSPAEDRKARAKELLQQGKSPAEVREILAQERAEAERADDEDADEADEEPEESSSGGGLLGGLFGGKDDGAWKKDLAERLLRAGVPKSEVAAKVREADERFGDLDPDERDDALDRYVDDASE